MKTLNAILNTIMLFSALVLVLYILWYFVRFIYNGLITTTIPMWGPVSFIIFVIALLVSMNIGEQTDKTLKNNG
jgi:hypothetical protein